MKAPKGEKREKSERRLLVRKDSVPVEELGLSRIFGRRGSANETIVDPLQENQKKSSQDEENEPDHENLAHVVDHRILRVVLSHDSLLLN
jgi:hypothetical protein